MKTEFYSNILKKSIASVAVLGLTAFSCYAQNATFKCTDKANPSLNFTITDLPGDSKTRILKTYFSWNTEVADTSYVRINQDTHGNMVTETYSLVSSIWINSRKQVTIKYDLAQPLENFEVNFLDKKYGCVYLVS